MRVHPQDLKTRAALDPAAFMAGIALFDEILSEADRLARADESRANGVWIDAELRHGAPLNLFAMPGLQWLLQCPESLAGFAAALGDYVASLSQGLAPDSGPVYQRVGFDSVWTDDSEPESPTSNVVRFVPRAWATA